MHRCLQLAASGAGMVAPNPLVGAVLMHNERIIGEGYHQKYGEPHAEVNCIASVKDEDRPLIPHSTLYVSLEPCAHFGKTPPCADLIIKHKIPTVVIGCRDPFKEVNGKGIDRLQQAGVEILSGILEQECKEINRRFFTANTKYRPYFILKWAETANGFIASLPGSTLTKLSETGYEETATPARLLISNEYTNRLVHKWRSEEAAVLIGTRTALYDNPSLTTRYWDGPSPVRVIIDMNLRLPAGLKIFDRQVRTIIINGIKEEKNDNLLYYRIDQRNSPVHETVSALHHLNIQSVLIEGGALLLQSFINEGLWDEARVIKNNSLAIENGLPAPTLSQAVTTNTCHLSGDMITTYRPAGR